MTELNTAYTPKLRLCGIEPESIVDGPGFRFTLFVQGCPHHCAGCHNPQTHSFEGGFEIDNAELIAQIQENPLLTGVTFSGGEPFCQAAALAELAREIKKLGKHIIVYSGYTLEQLQEMGQTQPEISQLLSLCDQLIDGPYVEALRDLTLSFRGSSNQRLINLHK